MAFVSVLFLVRSFLFFRVFFLLLAYDVDDLREGDAETDDDGLGLVGHGPFQCVVFVQQVVQQTLLVRSGHQTCKKNKTNKQTNSQSKKKVPPLDWLKTGFEEKVRRANAVQQNRAQVVRLG